VPNHEVQGCEEFIASLPNPCHTSCCSSHLTGLGVADFLAQAKLGRLAAGRDGLDEFELKEEEGLVSIAGTSPVALAQGVLWYLKYYIHASISWGREGTGDQVQ
jgi:hypothetical protein